MTLYHGEPATHSDPEEAVVGEKNDGVTGRLQLSEARSTTTAALCPINHQTSARSTAT